MSRQSFFSFRHLIESYAIDGEQHCHDGSEQVLIDREPVIGNDQKQVRVERGCIYSVDVLKDVVVHLRWQWMMIIHMNNSRTRNAKSKRKK